MKPAYFVFVMVGPRVVRRVKLWDRCDANAWALREVKKPAYRRTIGLFDAEGHEVFMAELGLPNDGYG